MNQSLMEVMFCSHLTLFRLSLQLFLVFYSVYHIEATSCSEHQKEFQNLCYEFIEQQLSFENAQKWCEQGGGHLAIIQNEKQYYFLRNHMPVDKKWWIGFDLSAKKSSQRPGVPVLSRLDGWEWIPSDGISGRLSPVCGYISWGSGYQQRALTSCHKEFSFICESGLQLSQEVTSSGWNILTISSERPHYIPSKILCSVDTGDGHVINTEVPEQSFRISHRYRGSGVFNIHIECQTKNGYLVVEKTVFIQELSSDFGSIQCSSTDQSDAIPTCRVRYGRTLLIPIAVGKGANLIHTASIGNITLHVSTVQPGMISVDNATQQLIGPGIHQMTIHVLNNLTLKQTSRNISIHLMEPLVGLEVTLHSTTLAPLNDLPISVALLDGDPVKRQFEQVAVNANVNDAVRHSKEKPKDYSTLRHSAGPLIRKHRLIKLRSKRSKEKTSEENNTQIRPQKTTTQRLSRSTSPPKDLSPSKSSPAAISNQPVPPTLNNPSQMSLRTGIPTALASTKGTRGVNAIFSSATARSTVEDLGVVANSLDVFIFWTLKGSFELMEDIMVNFNSAVKSAGDLTRVEQATALLDQLTRNHSKLTSTARVTASEVLQFLSAQLLYLQDKSGNSSERIVSVADSLFHTADWLFEAQESEPSATTCTTGKMMKMANNLIESLEKIQTMLLTTIKEGNSPIIRQGSKVSIYLSRNRSSDLPSSTISTPGPGHASFTLPSQNALKHIIDADPLIQIKMLGFEFNPFASFGGKLITGDVASLALLFSNNTEIAVYNLSENVEIMISRHNITKMSMKNYSSFGDCFRMALNVTSDEDTVVIHINSQENYSLKLFLGFKYIPTETMFQLQTVLPILNANGDRIYTWILTPRMLMHGAGVYYVMVTPSKTSQAEITKYNVSAFTTQCLFWEGQEWSSNQCHVGLQTTPDQSQCLCNHLTFFGSSFFVMPNTLDLTQIPELFAQTSQNPVVVSLVGAIFGVYIIAVVWARIKDRSDLTKVRVTVLLDNDHFAQYRYLIRVHTGHRRGAATTAKVVILLSGSEGHSDPHFLTDSEKPVFERGGVDEFLLTTFFSLGDLQSIRLWHDNSGSSPSWYVNRVTVLDIEAGQQWHFICNSWLGIDVDENIPDKIVLAASDEELTGFQNLFFMKTAESLTDEHIWFSVVERPPRSSFTRVQRVSCCFSLLLGSMLTNIMFWGTSPDESLEHTTLAEYSFFLQELMIGIESAFIMFPINLGIVQIFRFVRPRPDQTKTLKYKRAQNSLPTSFPAHPLTPESLLQDIKRIINLVYRTLKDGVPALEEEANNASDINQLLVIFANILQISMEEQKKSEKENTTIPVEGNPTTDLQNQRAENQQRCLWTLVQQVEENLNRMGVSKFQNPYSQIHAVDQVQKIMYFLRSSPQFKDTTYERNTTELSKGLNRVSAHPNIQKDEVRQRCFGELPWWFVYIAWFLVIVTSATSAFFTILYGLQYGKAQSIKWLISMATALFQSVFILQPVKVLCVAAFIALFVRKVDHHDGEQTFHLTSGKPDNALWTDRNSKIYQPPTVQSVEHMKEIKRKEKKMYAVIQRILVHLVFLSLLLTIAYGEQNPNSFYLNSAINQTFTPTFNNIRSINDFYTWANKLLLPNLYGIYKGFITDGYSKLLGSPRIQQLRVKTHDCPALKMLKSIIKKCEVPYSFDEEDMSNYGEQWTNNITVQASNITYIWQHQPKLHEYPLWRKLAVYSGSGYAADLTTEKENASRIVKYLAESNWIDSYTRAIFIEFTVYNANVNLFCVITLTLETNGIGAFITSTDLESIQLAHNRDITIMFSAVKIVYMLFIVYHMVMQGKLLKEQNWKYFQDKRNLIEMSIILCSWSAFALFLKRLSLENGTLDYYLKNPQRFVSFQELAIINPALNYIIAVLVALTTVKLWCLLNLNPKLHLLTSAMQRAWEELKGLFVIMALLLVAYSSVSYVMLGPNLSSYSTFFKSAVTMLSLQLGHFNYKEVLELYPTAGAIIISTSTIIMTFVILNLFLSVIMMTFTEEQHSPIPSEDQEVIDVLLKKLYGLFGIQGGVKSSQQKKQTENS
uniref:polycystin-1-like protein 2 n=1 Tax=Pristiophorus japonicus TaxID=55135 RepID=UPI00398E4CF1